MEVLLRDRPDDAHRGVQPADRRPIALAPGRPETTGAVDARPVVAAADRRRAALESRSYDMHGELTLGVHDSFCEWNEGNYALEAGPDGVAVSSSMASPDIELTAAELAAVYLGGVSFDTLARAGRVRSRSAEILDMADRMFRTPRAPWSLEM